VLFWDINAVCSGNSNTTHCVAVQNSGVLIKIVGKPESRLPVLCFIMLIALNSTRKAKVLSILLQTHTQRD
jgi:hypothetical protein